MAPLGKLLLLFVSLQFAVSVLSSPAKRQLVLSQPGASMGIFMPQENTNLGLTTGQYPNGIRGYWVDKNTKSVLLGNFLPDKDKSVISQGQCAVQTVQGHCWIPGAFQTIEGNKFQGMYFQNLPPQYGHLMHYIPTPFPKQESPLCSQSPNSNISPYDKFITLNGITYRVESPNVQSTVTIGGRNYVVKATTPQSLGYVQIGGANVPLQQGFPQSYVNVNNNNYIIPASTDPRFIGYVFINGKYYYVCPGNPGYIDINNQKHIIQIGEPGINNNPLVDTILLQPPVVPQNVILPKLIPGSNYNQLVTYVIHNGQVYTMNQDPQGKKYIVIGGHQYWGTGGNTQTLGYVQIDNQQEKIFHSYPSAYHVVINQHNYPVLPSNDPRYNGYVLINGKYYYVKPSTSGTSPGYIVYQGKPYPCYGDSLFVGTSNPLVAQKKITNFVIYNGQIYNADSLASGHVIISGQNYLVNGVSPTSLGNININGQQCPIYHGFPQSYIAINKQNYNLIPSNDPRYVGFVFANGNQYGVTYNQNNPTSLVVNKQPYQINIGNPSPTVVQPGLVYKNIDLNNRGFIVVNGNRQIVHSINNMNQNLYYVKIGNKFYIVYPSQSQSTVDQFGNVNFNGQTYFIRDQGGNYLLPGSNIKASGSSPVVLGFDTLLKDSPGFSHSFSNNNNVFDSFNNNNNVIGSFNGIQRV